ncbi:hypothetical protein HGRIS_012197 [Hohenbuehelia grisea]|uniref:Uncharacterized protein n=1 Tax=Hohenbuehelia grisea TaxID=104357 RepID=A0ABR3IRM1_9AGAR
MAFYQDYRLYTGDRWSDMKAYALFGVGQMTVDYLSLLVADTLLVWRLWAVYNKDIKVVIFPALLVFGTAIACFGYLGTSYHLYRNAKESTMAAIWALSYTTSLHQWNVTRMVLATTTNVVLTTMIAVKFIRHHRAMRAMLGSTTLLFESVVIIESGAIYALAWIVLFVVYMIDHYSVPILSDTIGSLAGIIPTLIIVTIMAGFSPVSWPDCSSRFPNPMSAVENSIVVDTRFSVALNPDLATSTFASSSPSSPIPEVPRDTKNKNTDVQLPVVVNGESWV